MNQHDIDAARRLIAQFVEGHGRHNSGQFPTRRQPPARENYRDTSPAAEARSRVIGQMYARSANMPDTLRRTLGLDAGLGEERYADITPRFRADFADCDVGEYVWNIPGAPPGDHIMVRVPEPVPATFYAVDCEIRGTVDLCRREREFQRVRVVHRHPDHGRAIAHAWKRIA